MNNKQNRNLLVLFIVLVLVFTSIYVIVFKDRIGQGKKSSSESAEALFPPARFLISAVGTSEVICSWEADITEIELSYAISIETDSGEWAATAITSAGFGNTVSLEGFSAGNNYRGRIRTVKDQSFSNWSDYVYFSALEDWKTYYPLDLGYKWTYQRQSVKGMDYVTEEVVDTTYIRGGGTGYVVRLAYSGEMPKESSWAVDDAGVYSLVSAEPATVYVFPLEVGARWQVNDKKSAEVLGYEGVSTPMGNFNAYKIATYTDRGLYSYAWLAKEIGMVKAVYRGNDTVTIEIVSQNF